MRVTLSYLPRPLYPLNGVFVFSNILQCISISVSWLWRKYIATILCTKLREVTLIYVYRTTYESYEDNLKHWNTQALEFRTPPPFSSFGPSRDYGIMVWIFVWKYIFEPFIHSLQHFVLQLSRSTNFCF